MVSRVLSGITWTLGGYSLNTHTPNRREHFCSLIFLSACKSTFFHFHLFPPFMHPFSLLKHSNKVTMDWWELKSVVFIFKWVEASSQWTRPHFTVTAVMSLAQFWVRSEWTYCYAQLLFVVRSHTNKYTHMYKLNSISTFFAPNDRDLSFIADLIYLFGFTIKKD